MPLSLPEWDDLRYGTMKRVALWLVQVVGEGKTFTKDELRAAFPGVSQVDRRARDLRDFGWELHTNKDDIGLEANEQRFVRQGDPVWEPGKATRRKGASPVSATARRGIFDRDGHMCRSCGIGAGEEYPEGGYSRAQLTIARRESILPDGTAETALLTECERCGVGGKGTVADASSVFTQISGLGGLESEILTGWITEGERSWSALDRIWSEYRALPPSAQEAVREKICPASS